MPVSEAISEIRTHLLNQQTAQLKYDFWAQHFLNCTYSKSACQQSTMLASILANIYQRCYMQLIFGKKPKTIFELWHEYVSSLDKVS